MDVLTRMNDFLSKSRSKLLLLLFVVLFFFPSTNYHVFSGIPLDSAFEFFSLIVLLPILLSRGLRRLFSTVMKASWSFYGRYILVGVLLALCAKIILFSTSTYQGIPGCYRSPSAAPTNKPCEMAYSNPFYRFGATRVDKIIDFGEHDWQLSFVNSSRFNFYEWVPGNTSRYWLPLHVTWRGYFEPSEQERKVAITYVGEVILDFGSGSIALPRIFGTPSTIVTEVPVLSDYAVIEYLFDDGHKTGHPLPDYDYATLRIHDVTGQDGGRSGVPFIFQNPPIFGRVIGGIIDAIVVVFMVGLVYMYWKVIRRQLDVLVLMGILGIVISLFVQGPSWFPKTGGFVLFLGILYIYNLSHPNRLRLSTIYFLIAMFTIIQVTKDLDSLNSVFIRYGGSDFLTYESFGRIILETGSLQAGEDVFYYQPLFRYLVFVEHILFGDGDGHIRIMSLLAVNFGVFWLSSKLFPARALRKLGLDTPYRKTGASVSALSQVKKTLQHLWESRRPDWKASSRTRRALLVVCTSLLVIMFLEFRILNWVVLPWMKSILRHAYNGTALAPIQRLFDSIAQDAYKTPLELYLPKLTGIYDWVGFFVIAALTFVTITIWSSIFQKKEQETTILKWFLLGLPGIFILMLVNSSIVFQYFRDGVSEIPTWFLIPFIIGFLFVSDRPNQRLAGTLFLGLSILFRTEHVPALALVFFGFLVFIHNRKKYGVILYTSLLGFILILPVLHNLYFGGRLVIFPTSATVPQGFVLPPRVLLEGLRDPAVLEKAWQQLVYLVYLQVPKRDFMGVSVAFHGLQIIWVVATIRGILSWRAIPKFALLLLAVPPLYLGVHYFYFMYNVLSRHVIMAHITMGLIALVVGSPIILHRTKTDDVEKVTQRPPRKRVETGD